MQKVVYYPRSTPKDIIPIFLLDTEDVKEIRRFKRELDRATEDCDSIIIPSGVKIQFIPRVKAKVKKMKKVKKNVGR